MAAPSVTYEQTLVRGVDGVAGLAGGLVRVSPDGKHLYSPAGASGLGLFSIDAETGEKIVRTRQAGEVIWHDEGELAPKLVNVHGQPFRSLIIELR